MLCNKTVNSITSQHFIVKSFLDFRHLAVFFISKFMEFTQAVFAGFTFILGTKMYVLNRPPGTDFLQKYRFIFCINFYSKCVTCQQRMRDSIPICLWQMNSLPFSGCGRTLPFESCVVRQGMRDSIINKVSPGPYPASNSPLDCCI